jgi:hypothetical protein
MWSVAMATQICLITRADRYRAMGFYFILIPVEKRWRGDSF